MDKNKALKYFEQCPKSLAMLKDNKQAWAFEHTKGIWKMGEDAGFTFERLRNCGMFHDAQWEVVTIPQDKWDFQYTYRMKPEEKTTNN